VIRVANDVCKGSFRKPAASIWCWYYIDGFNNPGFSGGPVLYWEFATRTYKILAVVKGYRNDTAKILINGKQVETNILVNSGILASYSIQHAIDAIEKNLAPGAPH
jgi:hypothetical protein